VTRSFKPLLWPLLFACAAAVAFSFPGAASATTPCWKTLLYDWADNGHIDKIYAKPCYSEAIAHLPRDIATYSDARQDIQRALTEAIGKKVGSANPETTTTTETLSNGQKTTKVITTEEPTTTNGKGPVLKAVDRLNPSSPTAFPLPLLILGALAILLVLAGLGGMLYRRFYGGDTNEPGGPATP
jgi:hypothetical protein